MKKIKPDRTELLLNREDVFWKWWKCCHASYKSKLTISGDTRGDPVLPEGKFSSDFLLYPH